MLKCKDIAVLADKYIDGELSFSQRFSFRMHIALCKHCNAYCKNLSLIVHKLKKSQPSCKCADTAEIDKIYNLISNHKSTGR